MFYTNICANFLNHSLVRIFALVEEILLYLCLFIGLEFFHPFKNSNKRVNMANYADLPEWICQYKYTNFSFYTNICVFCILHQNMCMDVIQIMCVKTEYHTEMCVRILNRCDCTDIILNMIISKNKSRNIYVFKQYIT